MAIVEQQGPPIYIFKGTGTNENKKLKFDTAACITCFQCVDVCPNQAFTTDYDSSLIFTPNNCEMDGGCASVCPTFALEFLSLEECVDSNSEAQAVSCAEPISIDLNGGSGGTYTKTYRWKIYKNIFNMWYYQSTETATIKQVTKNGQTENQYVSLVHSAVDFVGNMAIVTGSMSAVATPTVGIYHALMEISGVFSLHLVCESIPAVSSTSFVVTMYWNVND